MKAFSVKSNAKRFARKLCENHSGIVAINPKSAPNGEWYPAISIVGSGLTSAEHDDLAAQAMIDVASTAIAKSDAPQGAEPKADPVTDGVVLAPGDKPVRAKRTAAAAPAKTGDAVKPERGAKTAKVIKMISRKNGATIIELQDALGWQKHTVRGFVSTLNAKRKLGIVREERKGITVYRIAA